MHNLTLLLDSAISQCHPRLSGHGEAGQEKQADNKYKDD
jgi:hypothetical protein